MSRADHQPIPQSDDHTGDLTANDQVSSSLINSSNNASEPSRQSAYSAYSDPDFSNFVENPYRDTTESSSDINLRHIPMAQLLPHPWKTYEQVILASYLSVLLFFPTGLLAVRYAWRGKRHQSKGLMGMAQRELKMTVYLIYVSVCLGFLLFFIIIPVAASL